MGKKDFMSLTIKDSFMFYAVMSDAEQCRRLLTLVLDMEIETVTVQREETMIYHPDYHSIRLDVTAIEHGTRRRFNVEMQAQILSMSEIHQQGREAKIPSFAHLTHRFRPSNGIGIGEASICCWN